MLQLEEEENWLPLPGQLSSCCKRVKAENRLLDELKCSTRGQEKASQASDYVLISMREMATQDWYRLTPSQWKQWRTFKAPDVKRRRKVSLYLRSSISTRGEAKRNLQFIGGDQDRQLKQLWADTGIGDILPWEDVEEEAEMLLESARVNEQDSEDSQSIYHTNCVDRGGHGPRGGGAEEKCNWRSQSMLEVS
jgi:hypothetical protein